MKINYIYNECCLDTIDIAEQRLEHEILAEYNQEIKRHKQHSLF